MFNNNTSYQEAINAPSRRITGNVTIKGQKLSDDISSIDYVSSISGNTLTIGATNASTVDIKFKKLIEGLAERELIKVSFSVQTSSGIVERQIGEFFLTEIKLDRNNKTTTLKAMDKMAFLNDKYTSTLLYPTLGRNIVQEIANSCNLRVNNNLNITNLPSFSKKLEKVTYREMLGYLAQTVGAFVIFNNNGELEFRKLNRTQKQISKGSYLLKGLEVDEVEYRINGISISLNNQEKTILAVGSPLGTQVKLTNPLMTQGWLNSIFSEYSRLRFNPFKLNWRGDPFVEVGDWVSIEIANGSYRAFPILELKLSYSGGLKFTIGANVKGTTTSTTEYKGTVERQIEFINARLGASGNYVYADTVEPTNPKEGDTWFKPNGAFTDLYIYENNQWVLKTSTGNIEGLITKITDSSVSTQNLATAIAKIIELDAARITTGSLTFEQLSSNTVSEIRKGMVSETKFNSFVNDSNGLRQQMSSEIERVVESKKSTLKGQDGVSSYIHRKYSDNANGTPMSDNSNLKYIGIYTGNKQQAPTNPSEYSWTKIRGEDGARGRDGNNGRDGVDGKSINENLLPNSNFAKELENWEMARLNNSGLNWQKGHAITHFGRGLHIWGTPNGDYKGLGTMFNLTAKQGEKLTLSMDLGKDALTAHSILYIGLHYVVDNDIVSQQWQTLDLATQNFEVKKYKRISKTFIVSADMNKCRLMIHTKPNQLINFYIDNIKLERGDTATEWSPAYEDLRGRDGVSNYIHRKYSDFSNGANMSDNSNLKYIGIYTGTSPTPPTTASSYLWSKIKGEDGANGVPGAKGADGRTSYLHTAYANSPTGDRDFSTTNSNDKLYIGTYSDFEVADSTDYRRYKWVKIKGENGANGRNGTDGHSLTANLRLEGRYVNNNLTDLNTFVDVFYDGQKITQGFELRVKHKGMGVSNWTDFISRSYDNIGRLTNFIFSNGEKDGTPLEVIVLVTYGGLNTIANARMENVPDVVEIKEVVKKYKTFESTLEGFTSVVGEINTKILSKQQNRQNLNSEDVEKTGNDLYFNTKENLVANEYYTILADLDNVPANQQAYIYSASDGGDKKTIQNGLNYWVVKYSTNQTKINIYPLGSNTKVKNLRIFKGDFRVKKDAERENLYSSSATDSTDKFIHLNLNKNKINGNVYTVKFDASGYSNGDRWDIYNRIGYDENNLTQLLKAKGNELTFTINDNTTADRIYIRMKLVGNTTISNVEIYDVSTEYVKNSQVSKLESSIKQTKDEIDLKVSKDNVINSINISGEGTRIKGDLIADYLYGKTIEGAVIQGNSKIKIGKHGYMIPAGDGLRFCLPEKPDANKGVGVQMLGNYGRDGETAYGFYLYVDPNFDTTEVAATNSYLMTVNGYISARGVNNLKFQNYSDNSTAIGVWDKNVSLLFDRTKNDIYYEWNGKIYSIWQMVDRFYSTTSDARLKKDIRPCAYKALDLIDNFKFKSFNWKHREQLEEKPFTEIGLIAQDVEKISKNFVTMAGEYKTLNQFNLLTYSLKAIQELSTENQQLKSQLKEMNERLTKLEDKINGNL